MSFSSHDSQTRSSNTHNVLQAPTQGKKESLVKTENQTTTSEASSVAPQTSDFTAAAQQGLAKKNESLIKQINTREEFDKLVATIKDKYILVWFSAGWCRPCKVLAMKFDDLAQKYRSKLQVLKIDVDDMQDLAMENEVSTMPSYMIMRNGRKLAHYVGSKQDDINELVEKYLEEKSS